MDGRVKPGHDAPGVAITLSINYLVGKLEA